MAISIQIKATKDGYGFSIAKAPRGKAKGSTLHQRGMSGKGITVDVNALPANVLENLLLSAIEAKLQAAVKKLDQDKCTAEEAQAAMTAAFESLKSGKKTVAGKREQSQATKIRAEARKMLRQKLKERNDSEEGAEELDAKAYTEMVSDMFKVYDDHAKTKNPDLKAELAPEAAVVQGFLDTAKKRLEEQDKQSDVLDKLLAKRRISQGDDEPEARPTPTERVAAEKTGKKGRSN